MTSVTYTTTSVEETYQLGVALGKVLAAGEPKCLALVGDLGTGKTHLSQGIGYGFGHIENMTSPTFALMNTYDVRPYPLFHFDVYRLEESYELEGIGFEEYTEDQYTIVEWADKFEEYMPVETIWIHIDYMDATTRHITISGEDASWIKKVGDTYVAGY